MTWDEIMKINNPQEALKAIDQKVERENLSLVKMEEMVAKYAALHSIDTFEMAFCPNGEIVLSR